MDAPPVVETALPKTSLVLDSTDVLELSALDLESIDTDQLPGHYSSEQGGSVLYLTVTPQEHGGWLVQRVYTEPAITDVSRQYTVQRTPFGLADGASSLFLRKTSEGLIALENNSGLDSIPASYWIHYRKDEPRLVRPGAKQ